MRQHPLLYQINTRILLEDLARRLGRPATFDDLSDRYLDEIAERSFDLVWLLGVWRTSAASRQVSMSSPTLRRGAEQTLKDLSDEDISGSPFAIETYEARSEWGGTEGLQRLRRRLHDRGIQMILDFVPNHVGLEHAWLADHPEYFMHGTEEDLERAPENYVRVRARTREIVLAYGRDPHFPGWPDTLQLDYRHPGLRAAMRGQLLRIADQCDGVRCDMAMLLQPDVFAETWRDRPPPSDGMPPVLESFWAEAIAAVRRIHPRFLFMAEVYWGREWELQQEGFDYTYDKELYDRLRSGSGRWVREHLLAAETYQRRSVRFLENHDEPRAASMFALEAHRAAAVVVLLAQGLRFFCDGQLEGRRKHVSMHVGRRPEEAPDPEIQRFYTQLLRCLARSEVHDGKWSLCVCRPAWEGNDSWREMIVTTWTEGERRLLVAVNFAPHPGQCYVTLDLPELASCTFTLVDLMGDAQFDRSGDEMRESGLFLDMPPWGHHVFKLRRA